LRVKAVLFDLFETLVLTGNDEVYYPAALRNLHKTLMEDGISTDYDVFIKAYFDVRDEFYSKSIQSLEEPHFNNRISGTLKKLGYSYRPDNPIVTKATAAFSDAFMRYVKLDNETMPLLSALHGRYKLGIVSNFAIPEAVWLLLDKLNLRSFFKAVVISGEVNRRKPSREIFERALSILNLKASEAVFVGDTLTADVKGAQDAGMKAVLIVRKLSKASSYVWKLPETNIIVKPDAVISCLSQLVPIIEDC
jgi:putative hydrolase of the HAD superfamily